MRCKHPLYSHRASWERSLRPSARWPLCGALRGLEAGLGIHGSRGLHGSMYFLLSTPQLPCQLLKPMPWFPCDREMGQTLGSCASLGIPARQPQLLNENWLRGESLAKPCQAGRVSRPLGGNWPAMFQKIPSVSVTGPGAPGVSGTSAYFAFTRSHQDILREASGMEWRQACPEEDGGHRAWGRRGAGRLLRDPLAKCLTP